MDLSHYSQDERSTAEYILKRLNCSEPIDQTFVAELRALAENVGRGGARHIFNDSLSVVRHLGLSGDEQVVERVRSHFGRKGYVEKSQFVWSLTIVWTRPAGDPLLIVAHAWMAMAFSVKEFFRIYDAKDPLAEIAEELDAVELRVEVSQKYVASSPRGSPLKNMKTPTKPKITMSPLIVNQRRTPSSMRQTFPQRYPGRFLEGGAPGLGKRA